MGIKKNDGFQSLGAIFIGKKNIQIKKPPAYPWQDLALKIIAELGVPGFKRNSIFKICRDNPQEFVERCLNDTKELCKSGECWKYFLKVVNEERKRREVIK
ncbi:MAG TPA: hypothetical protein VMD74_02765 [Candidatus Methylomirabilis sp.]|nr:hypothetical protein [Candidatus Methylomirabilis sp.]